MIPAPLQRLESSHRTLIRALDANDLEAIESGVAELGHAVEAVRVVGAWRDRPEVVEKVRTIAALAKAAQMRVNFLTDLTQQRIEALAAARGRVLAGNYGSDGRRAG
jgi:hypothetical protein